MAYALCAFLVFLFRRLSPKKLLILGLFGEISCIIQILIVFAIWTMQLIVSPIWLRHFRFGPAEWLWRSLTYWKIQPLRA